MATSKRGKSTGETTIVGRQEITRQIAARAGLTQKQSSEVLEATLEAIRDSLEKGHEVRLVGFGSFKVRQSAARQGVNPRTGQPLQVAARDRVRFFPGKELADAVSRWPEREAGLSEGYYESPSKYPPYAGYEDPPGTSQPPDSPSPIQTCRCPYGDYAIEWRRQFAGDHPPRCPHHHVELICT